MINLAMLLKTKKHHQVKLISIFVLLPLFLGTTTYVFRPWLESQDSIFIKVVRNRFADATWAFSFVAFIQLTTEVSNRIFWLFVSFILILTIEVIQRFNPQFGQFDIIDIYTMSMAAVSSFFSTPEYKLYEKET